jgi:hypothetical protein
LDYYLLRIIKQLFNLQISFNYLHADTLLLINVILTQKAHLHCVKIKKKNACYINIDVHCSVAATVPPYAIERRKSNSTGLLIHFLLETLCIIESSSSFIERVTPLKIVKQNS